MVLTEHSHIFLGIDENSLNQIVSNNMRQRPSDFIWGTRFVEENLDGLGISLDVVEDIKRGPNPPRINNIVVGQNTPLEINVGKRHYGLDYWYQIKDFVIDLYPYNRLTPPVTFADFKENFLIVKLNMLMGIALPPNETFNKLLQNTLLKDPTDRDMKIIPITKDQFKQGTIEVYVAAHFEQVEEIEVIDGNEKTTLVLVFQPDKIEFTLDNSGLNNILTSYFLTLIYLNLRVIFTRMRFDGTIKNFIDNESLKFDYVIIPQSPNFPFNPKIEEDQLKLFVNWEEQTN